MSIFAAIPEPFIELMGQKYWNSLTTKQLWTWIEVVATDKNEPSVGGFEDATNCIDAEDILLKNWTLRDSCLDKYELYPTELNIALGQVETSLRDDGELKEEHYLPFVSWCVSRLQQFQNLT